MISPITDSVIKDWLNLPKRQQSTFLTHEIYGKNRHTEFHRGMKRYCKLMDSISKRYFYLMTFTLRDYKPDIHDHTIIQRYIISRLQRSALQIVKSSLVMELTKKGVPHWHVAVISKKFISKDRFKYYTKKFGFVDISKNHSQNWDTMYKYIKKETEPIVLLDKVGEY